MKLAITETILGAVITIMAGILSFWYLPGQYSLRLAGTDDMLRMVFFNPGPNTIIAHSIVITMIFLGLAVLGCGIFQIMRSRRS